MENYGYEYGARNDYMDYKVAQEYEKVRYSGWIGKYRWLQEQNAIRRLIQEIPEGITICDIPCGTGRFWKILSTRASRIIALDISDGMVKFANENPDKSKFNVIVEKGDATRIQLDDNSVDYVFCHALTKHLPIPVQYKVLSEFSRISKQGIICSFGIFSHLTYEIWRHRHLFESYPVFIEELEWMAKFSNIEVIKKIKCTTPIGVEHVVLFRKPHQ